ncbi:uncharacterized protein UBRO_01178 [Ustilago bromivora]|uniref:Uncharacterized protein n=1 Tax=Ustilago bromivora TaxID=307758 RepID=A0A1K0FUT8_9BASI|nr:uncharacterized protein UBRO_01178 [Ustilago bromivora]SYW82683.1 uncharacterized protein UBRO2_04805 [Ustilago bromivora]
MSSIKTAVRPAVVLATQDKRRQHSNSFSSDLSKMWYDDEDNNDSCSGEDKEDDGDTDSTLSTDNSDAIVTPEASPQHRHAILHGEEDDDAAAAVVHATVVGAFDANGNWAWSTQNPRAGRGGPRDPALAVDPASKVFASVKPALNGHDRTQIFMTGGGNKLSCQRQLSDTLWSDTGNLTQGLVQEDDDNNDSDLFDVVGYASYHSRTASTSRAASEGHSIVVPIRIRLEEDSSSDESECSFVTTSSSGSDSEARRRASINMLQRLGRTITIPERRTSAIRLGQGAPRRPPSLDEISSRVVAGVTSLSGRSSPPGTAIPHQRAVSCPSPLPLQRAWFGEVEVMVTPPSPQMPAEKIPGVVFKSPHMPSSASFTDAYGQLTAPAFDVAPGRQILMEERERQAKEWLEKFKSQQQERRALHLQLGAGVVAPPMANIAQAAATFTPSSPTCSQAPPLPFIRPQDGNPTPMLQQHNGAPPIPPRRRSFARRVSEQTAADQTLAEQTGKTQSDVVQVPKRIPSPIKIPTSKPKCRVQPVAVAPRRSLVARLSPRRSSKEWLPGQAVASQSSQITRKPVPPA